MYQFAPDSQLNKFLQTTEFELEDFTKEVDR